MDAVHDDWEGFRIWFSLENKNAGVVAIVKFESVLLYTNSDEGYRLSGIKNIEQLKFPHLFWKVEESELLKEFHRQSEQIYEGWNITHYAFLSASDCVDVLSVNEPAFTYLLDGDNAWLKDS
ncbi:MAG TPA: hypothetical protein VGW12_10085 [Pyrinomonadaceae bacterium]|nr:hypothetical protein [Pyrinomonadaceae bacterium]